MYEVWTDLMSEMHEDGTITIEKDAHYEWDDDGNEFIVRKDVDVKSTWDLFASVANSMIDYLGDMFEDGTSLDYGEFWFIAYCNGVTKGYCINNADLETLNEEGVVTINPLTGWDAEIAEAEARIFGPDDDPDNENDNERKAA